MYGKTCYPGNQPVGDAGRKFATQPGVLAVFAPAVYKIVACVQFFQHLGDIGRVVLQITVDGDNDVSPGQLNPCFQGGRLAKISTKSNDFDIRVAAGEVRKAAVAPIVGAVVDKQHFT